MTMNNRPIYRCRNEECPESFERMGLAAPELVCLGESGDAWTFKCRCCEKQGRNSMRVITKNFAGGTVGAGVREGFAYGRKGLQRYTHGVGERVR